ncbi:MAG: bifunctional folylpolyglutamate synthase/dihydrofolate synthase [Acidobacteria bacterium]|nr:bifunctional folylpolyglutamate synthase/dihydrofolate synthase [Acidobacteriota bacterium]
MKYTDFSRLLAERGNEVQGIHLGLHRITGVISSLGNPHLASPVLHIGGTNGKGSVAAMSDSILRHAGWKSGLYTSPHLVRLGERIRVNGCEIPPRRLAAVAEKVFQAESRLLRCGHIDRPLTYFEVLTACAFCHFASERVDVAVVEVGLGGRLDATNVVQPQVCVITGISYDHQALLGRTLSEIASEKAGIIKPGVPVVSGCRPGPGRKVIREQARALGAPLWELDRDIRLNLSPAKGGRCIMDLQTPRRRYARLRPGLAGLHQARNAALSVAAVEALKQLPAGPRAIRAGLRRVEWPGRMDLYDARRATLLDGAHNPEGARVLKDFLERAGNREVYLVFGVLRDKEVSSLAGTLFPLAKEIHLARVRNSRGMDPDEIASRLPRFRSRIRLHQDALDALRSAWERCPARGLVVVTGSLYLVGELIEAVRAESPPSVRGR